ncbi:MAG: glycosyltransferase [Selenomonadaceae bacterium]|nr:glycosyltransferase [Selenomonadaceae bacterium]
MRKIKSTKKPILKSKVGSTSKIKISACYIVKNEEKMLQCSIESLKSAVDEIIVVDTGSTDKTIEIAKSYGAKVIETTWQDDFSTPRNLAIDNATGDWIIFIDADEYFIKPNKVRSTIEKLSDTEAIFMLRIDVDEDNGGREINRDYYLRAFRNVDYLRYKGLIHENVENINGDGFSYKLAGDDLILYHTGYSATKAKSKLQRNLAILQTEIAKEGIQIRHHIALVDCYFALGDYEKVLQHAKEIIKTNSRPLTGLALFYRKTSFTMRKLNVSVKELMELLNEAIEAFPNDPEFRIERGMLLNYLQRYEEAAQDVRVTLKNADKKSGLIPLARDVLAEIERKLAEVNTLRKLKPSKKIGSNKKASKLKISVCYIVKNEEHNLPRSIDSLKDQVDEIVVVDTGSTDNTIEVAKSYGAKVFESPWNNDFSTPRNMALDNATGDWIIFLDADEYFSEATAKNVRQVIEQSDKFGKNGLLVNLVNIDVDKDNKILDTTYILRMYRNIKEWRFVGRIHEELRKSGGGTIDKVSLVPTNKLELYHTGYSTSINADKARRNLELLLAELKLTDHPEKIYGYIAQCYNGLFDYENAEKYAIMDIDGGRRETTFASSSYRILLNILAKNPKRMEDRLKFVARAIQDFPETPEFYAEYAECLAAVKRYSEAIEEMEMALNKFVSYDSLEPMMFNEKMAEAAKKRLELWRKKLNAED